MKAVFLDYGTVNAGDLDPCPLQKVLPELELIDATPDELVSERIAGREVVLLNKALMSAAVIAANPALRFIGLTATGTNNVALEAARERGIAVCNVRDYCTQSVVQHVFAVMLALTHGLREYDALIRSGAWQQAGQFTMLVHPIRELAGRRLGIVGYGTLGQAVARLGAALGMDVLVANRPGGEPAPGRLDLDELLPQVDVLSLHCPITPATENLLDAARLARLKPDALLINTARGGLVDAAALAAALRAGRLGGAAIDVLAQEPPVAGNPLLANDIPKLLVTPHIAWAAREARQRAIDQLAANLGSWLAGGRLGRVV